MKNKVILLLPIILMLTGCGTFYKLSCSQYLDGYWGDWKDLSWCEVKGQPDEFIVYAKSKHPSEFGVRVMINNYDAKAVKRLKKNEALTFNGTVEYRRKDYRVSQYLYSQQSKTWVESLPYLDYVTNEVIKRNATIKVYRNFDGTITYNALFDGVGVGLCIPW